MSPTSAYQKLPKRHIRLLILLPGEAGSAFQGLLELACIDSNPVYEALSYTWGAPEAASTLYCQGFSIPLTANLCDALSRLRLPDTARVLWVDQICLYVNRYRKQYHRNLRFGPLFFEGFRFASRLNIPLLSAFASPYPFFCLIRVPLL